MSEKFTEEEGLEVAQYLATLQRDWRLPHLIEGYMDRKRTWFLAQPDKERQISIKTFATLVAAQLFVAEHKIEISFIQPLYPWRDNA